MTAPRPPGPVRSLAFGAAMGAADAVPGISGGTVALLLGIYAGLVRDLDAVVHGLRHPLDGEARRDLVRALRFLAPLGAGVLGAYYLSTKVLVGATAEPGLLRRPATAPYLYGGFAGLVLASAVLVARRVGRMAGRDWALLALAAVGSFLFVGLPHVRSAPPSWALVPGGAAAIAVMLLPGVSGSLLLVVLGQYAVVVTALHDREVVPLALFTLGLALGVVGVVPVLRRLLERHPRPTFAALTGLMVGSTRALWPWKHGYDPKAGELANRLDVLREGPGPFLGVLGAVLLGAAAVAFLDRLERSARAAPGGEAQPA